MNKTSFGLLVFVGLLAAGFLLWGKDLLDGEQNGGNGGSQAGKYQLSLDIEGEGWVWVYVNGQEQPMGDSPYTVEEGSSVRISTEAWPGNELVSIEPDEHFDMTGDTTITVTFMKTTWNFS